MKMLPAFVEFDFYMQGYPKKGAHPGDGLAPGRSHPVSRPMFAAC